MRILCVLYAIALNLVCLPLTLTFYLGRFAWFKSGELLALHPEE